jgi:hypothetical protein
MENPRQPDIDKVREMLRQRDKQVMGREEDEGPDVARLEEDSANDPDDSGLKDVKGD